MKAIVVTQYNDQTLAQWETFPHSALTLPLDKAVKIQVSFSSLNYKDALAITGKGKIIKQFPFVVGIDLVGRVLESPSAQFEVGQKVICTGFGYGETAFGGLSEIAYILPEHLVALPEGLTEWQAMAIGTAGFTAMLAVNALLEANVTPNKGEVLVTGASGGVGSVAIALLARLGYRIGAVTGKIAQADYLHQLGAKDVYDRETFELPTKLLDKQQFSGVIDSVGGTILANILSKLKYNGCAVACGLAQSPVLQSSVMPFILRGVRLQGIDSVYYPQECREFIWQQLVGALDNHFYQTVVKTISVNEVIQAAQVMVEGKHTGRFVVKL